MLLGNEAMSSICLPAVTTKRKSFSSLNNQLILGKGKHIYNSKKYQKYQSYFLHSKSLRLLTQPTLYYYKTFICLFCKLFNSVLKIDNLGIQDFTSDLTTYHLLLFYAFIGQFNFEPGASQVSRGQALVVQPSNHLG